MQIIIKKINLPDNPENIARKAGYGLIHDHQRDKESYVRHFGRGRYPRLHLYLKQENDLVIFDLHLDQKETSYGGSHMHNAEYDGEVVEGEIFRIKKLISDLYRITNNT